MLCEEPSCTRNWLCPFVYSDRSVTTQISALNKTELLMNKQVGQSVSVDILFFLKISQYFTEPTFLPVVQRFHPSRPIPVVNSAFHSSSKEWQFEASIK